MARAKIVRDGEGNFYGIQFECPGCALAARSGATILPVHWRPAGEMESPHQAGLPHWSFNGNLDRPTFGPSVLTRWNWPAEDGEPEEKHVCHSFVRNGRIQFLTDSTHALAGKTVDLPEID